MALALTVINAPNGNDNSQKRTMLQGTGVFSGDYAAGGDGPGGGAINWNDLLDEAGDAVLLPTTNPTPLWVEFQIGVPASASPLWYILQYNYATGLVQAIVTGAASGDGFSELAAGAYPAALTGATIYWKAEFQFD